jgi:hypothetical protein
VEAELPPAVKVRAPDAFTDVDPRFELELPKGADQFWWQIASSAEFSFILPNFDNVQKPADSVAISRLSGTFFNDGDRLFLRAKARVNGVWSNWSQPHAFSIGKPLAPRELTAVLLPSGDVQLQWKTDGAGTFLIFGSNRRDFLPEIYAPEEIVRMRHLQVVESRPNKNLLTTTREPQAQIAPGVRYVRVVAQRGSGYSPPSALLELPPAATAQLPPAKILQVRAKRVEGAEFPNGYRDEYLAEERDIPHVLFCSPEAPLLSSSASPSLRL